MHNRHVEIPPAPKDLPNELYNDVYPMGSDRPVPYRYDMLKLLEFRTALPQSRSNKEIDIYTDYDRIRVQPPVFGLPSKRAPESRASSNVPNKSARKLAFHDSSNVHAQSTHMLAFPPIPEADANTTPAASADVKNDAKDEPPKEPKAEMSIPAIIDAVVAAGAPKRNAAKAIYEKTCSSCLTVDGKLPAVPMPSTAEPFNPIEVASDSKNAQATGEPDC